jgi:hypothetical protein
VPSGDLTSRVPATRTRFRRGNSSGGERVLRWNVLHEILAKTENGSLFVISNLLVGLTIAAALPLPLAAHAQNGAAAGATTGAVTGGIVGGPVGAGGAVSAFNGGHQCPRCSRI